jgi:Methyltransferase domain
MNCYLYNAAAGRGDVVYGLAVTKLLGDGVYIFNVPGGSNNSDFVEDLRRLLLAQPHVKAVHRNVVVDSKAYTKVYDMARIFKQPALHDTHIPKNTAMSLGIYDFKMYWDFVRVPNPVRKIEHDYVLFSRTARYRDPDLSWRHVVHTVYENSRAKMYFVGFVEEYEIFVSEYQIDKGMISFLPTVDLYEVAEYIHFADEVYTNQTSFLTLAQGMGKNYHLEVAPYHTNCVYESVNENLLNVLPHNYKRHHSGVVEQMVKYNHVYDKEYISSGYSTIRNLTDKMGKLRYGYLVDNIGSVEGKKVLEVGYGNGSYLEAISDNCDAYGFDITGIPVPAGVTQEASIVNSKYDVICMFDVLEHYHSINDIAQYNPEYFYISVPNCKFTSNRWFINWKHRKPNEHVFHFNKHSLTNFMNSIGYVPVCSSYVEDEIRKGVEDKNILSMIFKRR